MAALTISAAGCGATSDVPALTSMPAETPPGNVGNTAGWAILPLGVAISPPAAEAGAQAGFNPLNPPSTEITAFETASGSASAGVGTDTMARPLLGSTEAVSVATVSAASIGPPCHMGADMVGVAATVACTPAAEATCTYDGT